MSLPDRLGRLRRVKRIGAGGFATVWLYHDDELDSPVAVKALADNWASRTDIRNRFLEEARILRRADSDHVVRVYDIGEHDGTPYFVMSYADRGTVANLLEPGGVTDRDLALDLLEQAATGLSVLHKSGIIHRDVKPQNLLLRTTSDDSLRLMVADLGMAKADLHASGLTQVVGTPAYMAPEQASMDGLSKAADTYALAAVAYRLLTGVPVREGGLAEVVDGKLPAPASEVADLPDTVDAVFTSALHLDPTARPTPAGFVRELRAGLNGEPLEREVPPPVLATPVAAPSGAATLAAMPEPTATTVTAPAPAERSLARGIGVLLLALLVFTAAFIAAYLLTGLAA